MSDITVYKADGTVKMTTATAAAEVEELLPTLRTLTLMTQAIALMMAEAMDKDLAEVLADVAEIGEELTAEGSEPV